MHFLNLEKADDLPIQKGNSRQAHLTNWMKIISINKKEDRYMLVATSSVLELLNEKIEEIVRSPEEQRRFDSRMKMRSDIVGGFEAKFKEGKAEGIKEGMRQGIEKGKVEGAYKTKLETAKKLLEMKMSIKDIAEATGLKKEEVTRLK